MAPKTIKMCLAEMLEDLKEKEFEGFCFRLVDYKGSHKVRRNRVENKSRLEVADVLVTTFTEDGVVDVAVAILEQMECSDIAKKLVQEIREQSPKAPTPNPQNPGNKHFVDKHKIKLIEKVTNVAPILDMLLDQEVIDQEIYDKLMAMPTTQEKMRELLNKYMRGGDKCKNILLESLEKHEKWLIEDLRTRM